MPCPLTSAVSAKQGKALSWNLRDGGEINEMGHCGPSQKTTSSVTLHTSPSCSSHLLLVLALEESARDPARSCYHLWWEGLAWPSLTPFLWQLHLGAHKSIREITEVSLQEMSLLTAKEDLFPHRGFVVSI